jgi:hypothetical protein
MALFLALAHGVLVEKTRQTKDQSRFWFNQNRLGES